MSKKLKREQYRGAKIKTLWNIFIFILIEVICVNIYLMISAISGKFVWTLEDLTSSPLGLAIQIINLISFIVGAAIALLVIMYLILLVKSYL